jgi:hypothetical protein
MDMFWLGRFAHLAQGGLHRDAAGLMPHAAQSFFILSQPDCSNAAEVERTWITVKVDKLR